jgi:uncharacterized phage protein gp47/JayE
VPFNRPSFQGISARVKGDLASALGSTAAFFRRSVERALQGAQAGVSHQLHGHMDWVARQLDPRSADADMVEKVHGEPFGVYRKDAEFAQLTIEAAGSNGTTVDAGTVWVRSDGARYTTDDTGVVADGVVELAITAEEAGDSYNCDARTVDDDGTELSLESPIVGMAGTAEVTATTNEGTDLESDDDYLARVLARRRSGAGIRAGALGDFEQWALEVAGVTRAWDFPRKPRAGWVTIYAVNDAGDPITLSGPKLAELEAYIGQPGRKPSTAQVAVLTPTLVPVDFEIQGVPSGAQEAVRTELRALLRQVGSPRGITIALSKINEAISIAPGEDSHVLVSPATDVVVPVGSLPVLGEVVFNV